MDRKIVVSLLKGLITFLPGFTWYSQNIKQKSYHSCSNSRFCYSLWLRSLILLDKNNLPTKFHNLGEVGTGGSLGLGICSLLTATKNFYALDIENNFNIELNIKLLDELFELFSKKTSIPDNKEFPQINYELGNYDFPENIITDEALANYVNDNRYNEIKESIVQLKNHSNLRSGLINIIPNWEEKIEEYSQCFDLIFSRAVMEHVKYPAAVYNKLATLIKVGGLTLHDIELHSHDLTKNWNGHYFINDLVWKIISGKRKYFLNRHTASFHKESLAKNDFKIVACIDKIKGAIANTTIDLTNADYSTYGIFILGKKMFN